MIISVHVPKTAGISFLKDLTEAFGPRLWDDYGDWPESFTPESRAHDERRRAEMLARAEELRERCDIIHGHFTARKYAGVFANTALVTFVRDPYQHAISTYEHAVRAQGGQHPGHRVFKEANMSLLDLVEAYPNHQSLYFGGIPIDDFAMVGMTERYEQSVALFEAMFGTTMPRVHARRNANPKKGLEQYEISTELRDAVERHRTEDIALYRRAGERFDALCRAHGV
jgi:hypothetical protein